MSDFFSSVEFENYGPIKKGTLKLTRLHALIGPNDSGKSCTLDGLRSASTLAESLHQPTPLAGPRTLLAATKGKARIRRSAHEGWQFLEDGKLVTRISDTVANNWGGVRSLRLDPDFLRRGVPLLSDGSPLDFVDDRGTGLGSLLDAVFSRDVKLFLLLETTLKSLFPTVSGFRLFTDASGGRRVGVKLLDGTEVRPEFMSEGMLYFLAFALLPYLRPVSLILIEEPENGLHPSRIVEVMNVLRSVSETTQVVLATHSPLVINELKPDEVTLVTRTPEDGTRFTPIAETPNFTKRSNAFALGELWLNYADGISEAPLLQPTGTNA